jgi:hypothetical protein
VIVNRSAPAGASALAWVRGLRSLSPPVCGKALGEIVKHDWERVNKLTNANADLLQDLKRREGLRPDWLVRGGRRKKGEGKGLNGAAVTAVSPVRDALVDP